MTVRELYYQGAEGRERGCLSCLAWWGVTRLAALAACRELRRDGACMVRRGFPLVIPARREVSNERAVDMV